MKESMLNGATVLIALCTAVLTGITVWREFGPTSQARAFGPHPPLLLADWPAVSANGHRSGPDHAEVTVVVFSDFECPGCAHFATETFPAFQRRHPGRSALVFRHWPLRGHRLAYPAGRASECAAAQGRFWEYHDLIFAQQEDLGVKSFREFAAEAGVPDVGAFDTCLRSKEQVGAIERDIQEAERVGGLGTPTVIVNGWMARGEITVQLLDSLAGPFLAAKETGGR